MIISNPGILDGSVTTSKIADGAVTNAKITGPISVANGGTGTATPALVAGTNISLSGSFPDQTVGVVDFPIFAGSIATKAGLLIQADSVPNIDLSDAAGNLHWQIAEQSAGGVEGDFYIYNNSTTGEPLTIDTSDHVHFANPLEVASGGTGATTLAGAAIPEVIYQNSVAATVIANLNVGTFAAPATGTYLIVATGHVANGGATAANAYAEGLNGSGGTPGRGRSGDMSILAGGNDDVTVCAMVSANSGDSLQANLVTTGGTSITLSGSVTILRLS